MGMGASPSWSVIGSAPRSDGSLGVEPIDELAEGVGELGVVVVGVLSNDVDDFAVVVRRLLVIASGLVDYARRS